MCAQCAVGEGRMRLARRFSSAAARILPGAVLLLLPKCPLCLAAWLTVTTGVGVSAAAGDWLDGLIRIVCTAAIALIAAQIFRRYGFRRWERRPGRG